MNVYIFSLNIVIFSESRNFEIINENFTNKICIFIGLGTLKPTRTRTLNRIPIWHGLNRHNVHMIKVMAVIIFIRSCTNQLPDVPAM